MSKSIHTLTNVAEQIYKDQFSIDDQGEYQLAGSKNWSITKYRLQGGLSEGVDVVELNNGLLKMSVLPTRGMGLWQGKLGHVDLGWDSPVKSPVNPAYVNLTERSGLGWLSGFNELMCRCGLSSHGGPGLDVVTSNTGARIETPLTLHGKIANLPAHTVTVEVDPSGPGTIAVTGTIDETMLFGPCLQLESRVEMQAGSNQLTIIDRVRNIGGHATEYELLYHTNFGRNLLEANSRFEAPIAQVSPRDARAAEDMDSWQTYAEAIPGYVEQCYFIDLIGDDDNQTVVLLKNAAGNRGASLRFDTTQLPHFTIWKNTQAKSDGYVTGLEPGTSYPNMKTFERENGRIRMLEPGAEDETRLVLAVHEGEEAVGTVEEEIRQLQTENRPIVHDTPQPGVSPDGK